MAFRRIKNPTPLTPSLRIDFSVFNCNKQEEIKQGCMHEFKKELEFHVCEKCGICEDIIEAIDLDWYERRGNKFHKQYYDPMDYFYRKMRFLEANQRIHLPRSIENFIRMKASWKNENITVKNIIKWLKKVPSMKIGKWRLTSRQVYVKFRRHVHFIMYRLTKIRIQLPIELKRDLALLFSRFIEIYGEVKLNKKKIPPFNFLMRIFIDIISQYHNERDYLKYKLVFKEQLYRKGHLKNIQVVSNIFIKLKNEYNKFQQTSSRGRFGRPATGSIYTNERFGPVYA